MRMHPFHRTELLVGQEAFEKLQNSSFCVIGLGGVGSWAAEALARTAVGHLTLVDFDQVCITNLNRQLMATRGTVGGWKAELMGERAREIHRKGDIRVISKFYSPETADEILDRDYDYVLDCIDNMTAKVHLVETCRARGIPVMSSLGAGGRMDPTRIRVTDLKSTRNDRFGAIFRDLLRKKGIDEGLECVWSDEPANDLDPFVQAGFKCICPNKDWNDMHSCEQRFQVQGTVPWITSMFGMTMAGAVVNRVLGKEVHSADFVPKNKRQAPVKNKISAARKKELIAQAGVASEGAEEHSAS